MGMHGQCMATHKMNSHLHQQKRVDHMRRLRPPEPWFLPGVWFRNSSMWLSVAFCQPFQEVRTKVI